MKLKMWILGILRSIFSRKSPTFKEYTMATLQELEQFMARTTPSERAKLFKKDQDKNGTTTNLNVTAQQAATLLSPSASILRSFGRGGDQFTERAAGGGTPGPGPRVVGSTRPAHRLEIPEQTTASKIDVSGPSTNVTAPSVPQVKERFLPQALASQKDLDEYIRMNSGGVAEQVGQGRGRGIQYKDPRTTAQYSALLNRRNFFGNLAKKETFATRANAEAPLRQQQLASAQNLLGEANFRSKYGPRYAEQDLGTGAAQKKQKAGLEEILKRLEALGVGQN
jgi:hypothetical protein